MTIGQMNNQSNNLNKHDPFIVDSLFGPWFMAPCWPFASSQNLNQLQDSEIGKLRKDFMIWLDNAFTCP